MREGIAVVAFTPNGIRLGQKLSARLDAAFSSAGQEGFSLSGWTEEQFSRREALIFIGAAGIAVRAVAPRVRRKTEDPAVLCVDEHGRYVIPLLSGHLGGANTLAETIAAITGGEAVITTATDINGLFAVDLWAKRQKMEILQPERIRMVSSRILRGDTISIDCPWPVEGTQPPFVRLGKPGDVLVSCKREESAALQLVPRIIRLGIGCKRGTTEKTLTAVFERFCRERNILPQAVTCAASIDRKKDEAGLKTFCEIHQWPLSFYSAEELRTVSGKFTASPFVEKTLGVDNVCERAAVLAGGRLIERKFADEGVTFAAAEGIFALDWSM